MKPKVSLLLLMGLTSLILLATARYADSQAPAPVNPDLTIFYTNDAWGYLEPCG